MDSTTHENTDSIVVTRDSQQNEAFLQLINRFWRQIPSESRPRASYETKTHLFFYDLGSSITVLPPKVGVGAGLTPSNIHASEFGLWNERIADYAIEGLFEAVAPTGNIFVESTPMGYANAFARLYREAIKKRAELLAQLVARGLEGTDVELQEAGAYWKPHRWTWAWKHGVDWARWKLAALGPRKFAQQFGCEFLQSGDSVYAPSALVRSWSFEDPVEGASYGWGADPAEGVGEDLSAFSIWRANGEFLTESFSCAGQWSPRMFAKIIRTITAHYGAKAGRCVGFIERNNHGHAVIQKSQDLGVSGMLRDPRDKRPGWLTSFASKASAQEVFFEAATDGTAKIADQALVEEMRTLEHNNQGNHVHQKGYHDDRYTAACLAVNAAISRQGPVVTLL